MPGCESKKASWLRRRAGDHSSIFYRKGSNARTSLTQKTNPFIKSTYFFTNYLPKNLSASERAVHFSRSFLLPFFSLIFFFSAKKRTDLFRPCSLYFFFKPSFLLEAIDSCPHPALFFFSFFFSVFFTAST